MFSLLCAAWCGHTTASRELADDLDAALAANGIKRVTAAEIMGLNEKALIRQIAGAEPMNIGRVAMLFAALPEVGDAFLARMASRKGGTYLTPHQTVVIKGASMLGPELMAQMLPQWRDEEERKRA